MNKINHKQGFTLVELIVVMAIFATISGVVTVSLSNFLAASSLENTVKQLVQNIRKAQSYSMMRVKDDQWGVYFDDNGGGAGQSFTFFKGSNYGLDASYDDVHELPDNLSFSNISFNGGGNEIVFEKVIGETINTGSIDVLQSNGSAYTITINTLGQLEIN